MIGLALLVAAESSQMALAGLQSLCVDDRSGCQLYVLGVTEGVTLAAGVAKDDAHLCIPDNVSAVVWSLPADERRLAEGAIARDGKGGSDGRDVGPNSYLGRAGCHPIRRPATARTTMCSSSSRCRTRRTLGPIPAGRTLRVRFRGECWRPGCWSAPIRAVSRP